MRHFLEPSAQVFFREMSISPLAIQKVFRLLYTLMRRFDNRRDHEERLLNRSSVLIRHRQSHEWQTIFRISSSCLSAMSSHVIATTAYSECKVMEVNRRSSAFVSPAWSVFAPTSELPYS